MLARFDREQRWRAAGALTRAVPRPFNAKTPPARASASIVGECIRRNGAPVRPPVMPSAPRLRRPWRRHQPRLSRRFRFERTPVATRPSRGRFWTRRLGPWTGRVTHPTGRVDLLPGRVGARTRRPRSLPRRVNSRLAGVHRRPTAVHHPPVSVRDSPVGVPRPPVAVVAAPLAVTRRPDRTVARPRHSPFAAHTASLPHLAARVALGTAVIRSASPGSRTRYAHAAARSAPPDPPERVPPRPRASASVPSPFTTVPHQELRTSGRSGSPFHSFKSRTSIPLTIYTSPNRVFGAIGIMRHSSVQLAFSPVPSPLLALPAKNPPAQSLRVTADATPSPDTVTGRTFRPPPPVTARP